MKFGCKNLDEATSSFISILSESEKAILLKLAPNPRTDPGRSWIDRVIFLFDLQNSESDLCVDIAKRFPHLSIAVGPTFDNGWGIFEAEMIILETQKILANH